MIVAICAHENTEHLQKMLENWRKSLGRDRVYLLFDATKSKPPKDPHLLQFTNQECASANRFHVDNWTNVEYKISLLDKPLKKKMCEDDFIWMIESDVGCDGDITTCLHKASSSRADFMAFNIKTYVTDPKWTWWDSLRGEIDGAIPLKKRIGCFFPVTRYSRAMVDAVIRNMGKSSGFCEIYIPTLAMAEGLVVEELPSSMKGDVGFAIYKKLPEKRNHVLYHKYVPSSSGNCECGAMQIVDLSIVALFLLLIASILLYVVV